MAKNFMMLALVVLLGSTAQTLLATEGSVEQGKTLFNDPTLGGSSNPGSCNACHQDGKGLENAGTKENLTAMINACIVRALLGEKLDEQSAEMASLKLYITSLGK